MKRLKIGIVVSLLFVVGCQTTPENLNVIRLINDYPYYETSIDNLPPEKNVSGIFVMLCPEHETELAKVVLSIGYPDLNVLTIKSEYKADIINTDCSLIPFVVNALKKAKRVNNYTMSDIWIALLTRDGAYMITCDWNDDDQQVYGVDYESKELWDIFKRTGLLDYKLQDDRHSF